LITVRLPEPLRNGRADVITMSATSLADVIAKLGIEEDRDELYNFAINGELIALPDPAQRNLFKALADRRVLLVQQHAQRGLPLSRSLLKHVYDWYLAGWVHPRV